MHPEMAKRSHSMSEKLLPVYVYRSRTIGDCTNGGASAKFDTLYVLCDEGFVDADSPEMFAKQDSIFQVVPRTFRGMTSYHLEPIVPPHGAGWMDGGNYAASCDGRFSRMVGDMYGAVPIHDRQETWEQYEALSR